MALGAQKRDIFRLIVGEGMGLAAVGVLVGLAGAMGLSRFLESLLFEIRPSDPLTFSSGAICSRRLRFSPAGFLPCVRRGSILSWLFGTNEHPLSRIATNFSAAISVQRVLLGLSG